MSDIHLYENLIRFLEKKFHFEISTQTVGIVLLFPAGILFAYISGHENKSFSKLEVGNYSFIQCAYGRWELWFVPSRKLGSMFFFPGWKMGFVFPVGITVIF